MEPRCSSKGCMWITFKQLSTVCEKKELGAVWPARTQHFKEKRRESNVSTKRRRGRTAHGKGSLKKNKKTHFEPERRVTDDESSRRWDFNDRMSGFPASARCCTGATGRGGWEEVTCDGFYRCRNHGRKLKGGRVIRAVPYLKFS